MDELALYPHEIELGHARLKADYRFNPGGEDDGITVAVPAASVHQVNPAEADWLVPGLLEEKITALLKALPKAYRRRLVPVGDTAALIAREMPRTREDLATALGNFIHRRFKVDIPATAWIGAELPAHLKMRFAVTGPDGETIAVDGMRRCSGRSRRHRPRTTSRTRIRRRWERDGITAWDFGDLPASIAADTDDTAGDTFFPALVRAGGRVDRCGTASLRHARRSASDPSRRGGGPAGDRPGG
jgi:ATP-dependent helicase HrpA